MAKKARMMSKTGIKGFTLIEVMFAVCILTLSTMVIQEGFLRSATLFGRYANTLIAKAWMEQKLWEIKEGLVYVPVPDLGGQSGSFQESKKSFEWSLDTGYARQGRDLYTLNFVVSWNEGNRLVRVTRSIVLAKCSLLT